MKNWDFINKGHVLGQILPAWFDHLEEIFFLQRCLVQKVLPTWGPVKTNIIALLLRMLLKPLQFIPWILIYIKACLREGTFWLGALILEMQSLVLFFFIFDIRMCYVQCSIC